MIPMSTPSWRSELLQALRGDDVRASVPRVIIVGVGHELCGDDAAGLAVARALKAALAQDERWLVIDAGPAPENQTGLLRRFKPDIVLLVDAAQMGEAPGAIRCLSWEETDGMSASTHTLPLRVLATYLIGELGCEVALLGIQPANNAVDAPLSPEIADAADALVNALVEELSSAENFGPHHRPRKWVRTKERETTK
jgi:hydrogenase maturation protease HycI